MRERYPPIEPYQYRSTGRFQVLHRLYFEEVGKPEGNSSGFSAWRSGRWRSTSLPDVF